MDALLQGRVLADQSGVGPLDLSVGACQLSIGDAEILDRLASLSNGPALLQQLSLQTFDVVREPAGLSPLRLEIFEGLLLGFLRGAPGDLAVHMLHLHLLEGLQEGVQVSFEKALLLVQVCNDALVGQGLLLGSGRGLLDRQSPLPQQRRLFVRLP